MPPEFDVVIVGSGPAGVSAAFPLIEAGLRVLMVDGGRQSGIRIPGGEYLDARARDPSQWEWMVGRNFHALRALGAVSPKFRAPTIEYVFSGFAAANRIVADNFAAIGSLASGGLSNAWGCGVARFSARELESFPFPESELLPSYEAVARRIGVSGRSDDDLADYFGLDAWAQLPVPMDTQHEYLLRNYRRLGGGDFRRRLGEDFRLGRLRLAVLAQEQNGRQACDRSGYCLWGCPRGAMYSARHDLDLLARRHGFTHLSGFIVDRIEREGSAWRVCGRHDHGGERDVHLARSVVLAAGTLATTRLVLDALDHHGSRPLSSTPIAAFMLWLPRFLGQARSKGVGLGQLSFSARVGRGVPVYGATFSTHALPISEFLRHMPFTRRGGLDILRCLLSSCVVGNCFLPGHLTQGSVRLDRNGDLKVAGAYDEHVNEAFAQSEKLLRSAFFRLGALMLPRSFIKGQPGADVHYAATLPMRLAPAAGETARSGEVFGLDHVFVVDGAALCSLPEKPHTMTIMANSDRIARGIPRLLARDSAMTGRAPRPA